ncbi:hypothetical protein QY96_00104 [Bacillus thermotolerans]|nr:hypothetical protein QY96_00104 [Bacillus thermotolerans]
MLKLSFLHLSIGFPGQLLHGIYMNEGKKVRNLFPFSISPNQRFNQKWINFQETT